MSRPLMFVRALWLGLLVWPYAVASGVPRPLALAALPLLLAVFASGGPVRFALRIAAALALGAVACLRPLTLHELHHVLAAQDLRLLTAFVSSILLWFTALLGWQVFRDAVSRTRLLWLWLMGTLVLGLNHRFWGVTADLPTLLFIGIGLLLVGISGQTRIRPALALMSLVPLLGALAGLLAASAPAATVTLRGTRALNLSGLRVATSETTLPAKVNINKPVSLSAAPILSLSGVPRASYWQEAVYDQFDGTSWLAPQTARSPVPGVPPLLPPSASGLPTEVWHVRVREEVPGSIGPVIYTGTPLRLSSGGGIAYELPAARALFLPNASAYGLELSVSSMPPSLFASASFLPAAKSPPGDLAVPKSLARELSPLAQELAQGAHSPYELALSIAGYLRSHEAYDPNFSPSRRGDPVGRFLLETHRGYCDQFSTAFIMLARLDGLPARWVVGFSPGPYDKSSHTEVLLAKDAHSWAEVDVAPYGWLPVDPTPASGFAAPPKKPSQTATKPAAKSGAPTDILAAVLALSLAAAAAIALRRPPSLRTRIARVERGFVALCPLPGRMPPTLRERWRAQSEPLRAELMPALFAIEQALYGPAPPSEPEVQRAEEALRAARRASKDRDAQRPPA